MKQLHQTKLEKSLLTTDYTDGTDYTDKDQSPPAKSVQSVLSVQSVVKKTDQISVAAAPR